MDLFDHQQEALDRMVNRKAYGLFMEQGTGKTRVTIEDAGRLFEQGMITAALIVAPNGVHLNWLPEFEKWLPGKAQVTGWRAGPTKALKKELTDRLAESDQLQVTSMNIEAFVTKSGKEYAAAFLRSHKVMMVVDESSRIKNPKALRTKSINKLGHLAAFRRILTGTPITQSPLDIYAQFQFLGQSLLNQKSFYSFRSRYAVMVTKRFGQMRPFQEVVGFRRMDELKEIIDSNAFRVLKKDCLDLPDKIFTVLPVILGPKQRRVYDELRTKVKIELSAGRVTVAMALTKLLRLQQVVGGHVNTDDGQTIAVPDNTRVKALIDYLEDLPGKIIIWARFVPEIEEILREIKDRKAVAYYGAVSKDDRLEALRLFQEDPETTVFVGNAKTGGIGLNLTAASTVIYYSNDFSLETRLQSEDRAHRIGTKNNVTYVDMKALDTVDEKIVTALRDKKGLADALTGDESFDWL